MPKPAKQSLWLPVLIGVLLLATWTVLAVF